MDHDTGLILDLKVKDKRETVLNSVVMETEAFKDSLSELLEEGLDIKEVVTDQHLSIAKYMRKSFKLYFQHIYDDILDKINWN